MKRNLQIYDEGFSKDGKHMTSEILEKEINTKRRVFQSSIHD